MDTAETIFYFCKSQMWRGLQALPRRVRPASTLQCGQVVSGINIVAT